MKSSRMKKILAVILCLTLGLSTNMMTMAESVNSPAVESVSEVQKPEVSAAENALDTMAVEAQTEQESQTESEPVQTPESTPAETEPEVTEAPIEAPQPTEVPEVTEMPEVTEAPTETPEVPETTVEPMQVPETTETPAVTPEPTEVPEVTETPEVTEIPTETPQPTEVPDASDVTENSEVVYEAYADDTKVTVTAENKDVFPEGTEIHVEKISDEEQREKIKDAMTEEAIEKGFSLNSMVALDISFTADGKKVQPNGKVTVSVEGVGVDETADLGVYHVDGEKNITEYMPKKEPEPKTFGSSKARVDFETTHFSTYVIVNESDKTINVTIQSYLQNGSEVIADYFKEQKLQADAGEKIEGETYDEQQNSGYELKKICQVDLSGKEKEIPETSLNNIQAVEDITLRIYYTPEEGQWTSDGVTLFDYDLGETETIGKRGMRHTRHTVPDENSINYDGNYKDDGRSRLAMGDNPETEYQKKDGSWEVFGNVTKDEKGKSVKINANNGSEDKVNDRRPIVTGLLESLTGTEYENVNFAYDDPGFFSKDTKNGKTVYADRFELNFEKKGDEYTFTSIKDKQTGKETEASSPDASDANKSNKFFPLDHLQGKDGLNGDGHNEYFGMRFDFTFKIGDYNGPLEYTFTGDDDLWVCLDGKVVLDLGGEHSGYPYNTYHYFADESGNIKNLWVDGENKKFTEVWPNTVDLWNYIDGGKENCNRDEEHQITILYMERGGGDSNCSMKFMLPNVKSVPPVISNVPKATLSFEKVDSEGNLIQKNTEFGLYEDKDGTKLLQTVSASNGKFSIEGLKEGIYYLKETQAPEGYVLSEQIYKITVKVTGDNATASLTDLEGKPINDNKIINYTEEEEIAKELDYNKYVTTSDEQYQNREYTVHLEASSKAETEGKPAGTAEIVLVLDKSSSMSAANMKQLSSAAQNFVNEMSIKSKDSQIAIVYFSDKEINNEDVLEFQKLDNMGQEKLINFINEHQQKGEGDTYINSGLKKANSLFDSQSKNKKYIVLFTDGAPDDGLGGSFEGATIANEAVGISKNFNGDIYAVGCGKAKSEHFYWGDDYVLGEDFLKQIVSEPADKYYKYISSTDAVKGIFEDIVGEIGEAIGLTAQTITDVLDPRFKLADGEEERLKADGAAVTTNSATGVTTITWSNQKIGPETEKNGKKVPGWQKEIKIKAKDDFIGGNMIPTNGADSGITLESGGTVEFQKPTVNVKLLSLSAEDISKTVFVGEMIDPMDSQNSYADSFASQLLKEVGFGVNKAIPGFNELIFNWEQENGVYKATAEYSYPGTNNDVIGSFELIFKPQDGKGNLKKHSAETPGEKAEEYVLTVTYKAKSEGVRKKQINSKENYPYQDAVGDEVKQEVLENGHYYINVLEGQIIIQKKLSGSHDFEKQGDAIFTFKIEQLDGNMAVKTLYKTVRFTEKNETQKSVALEGLGAGTYRITELETLGYECSGVNAEVSKGQDGITATPDSGQKSVTVTITKPQKLPDDCILKATAEFENTANGGGTMTDTDVIVNKFTWSDNGYGYVGDELSDSKEN